MNSNDDSGMSVFLRDEPEKPVEVGPPVAAGSGQGSNVMVVILAVVAMIVAAGGAAAWYVYQPDVDLSMRTPVEESYPYQESLRYISQSDDMLSIAGENFRVTDAGNTVVDWDISGVGNANIHLDVTGPKGSVEVWIEWAREQDTWLVKAANYRIGDGGRQAIPVGRGQFLTPEQLVIWRRADSSTKLGRGQRELVSGQYLQAVELFTLALDEGSGDDPAADMEPLYWRGRAFEALNNTPKAIADYQRLLTFVPDHAAALSRLDAMRASPPPGQPVLDTPNIEERDKVVPVAPVSLIPR